MNFCSDNVTGACPAVLEAVCRHNDGAAMPYGDDALTRDVCDRISGLFDCDASVFPVATGTAANALAMSVICPGFGAVYCHKDSHVYTDECGAPELFTGGAKLVPLDGADAKFSAETLDKALGAGWKGVVHHVQPAAVSITQASECGTLYRPEEIAAIAEVCRRHDLVLHMDGARFANAVAAGRATPAEMTWRAGVDVLSFGATKNGAMAAEAVVFFRPELAERFALHRKRGGHLFSKMRFISAQLDGYLKDNVWLNNANHANAMAAELNRGVGQVAGARVIHPVEANEIFVVLPEAVSAGLLKAGFAFYPWAAGGPGCHRLVTAWNTTEKDVEHFIACATEYARAA